MSIGKKIDLFLELPSVPIFYDTNGKVINNLTAPYTIKSELKVKCEVVGGKLNSSIVKKYSTFFVCSIYQYTLMKTNFVVLLNMYASSCSYNVHSSSLFYNSY